ncbi:hypothetical protein [Anaeromassilibacillus senegalensis]|nr:hypothetical protein [Anaeromassilibacillus senegalensis]
MSRAKKNRNQNDKAYKTIILITVIIQLISAIVGLIEKLIR